MVYFAFMRDINGYYMLGFSNFVILFLLELFGEDIGSKSQLSEEKVKLTDVWG